MTLQITQVLFVYPPTKIEKLQLISYGNTGAIIFLQGSVKNEGLEASSTIECMSKILAVK